MSGITDIHEILRTIRPTLSEAEYIFCTFKNANYGDHKTLNPIGAYREAEGLTLIIQKEIAQAHAIPFEGSYRAITLNVHSSLEAVGLTAAVSTRLAEAGISANMVAAYFHDHVYVPSARAEDAMNVLQTLQNEHP